jgi:hypothetical protein
LRRVDERLQHGVERCVGEGATARLRERTLSQLPAEDDADASPATVVHGLQLLVSSAAICRWMT